MKPGDILTSDDGRRWQLGEPLAEQGRDDCTSMECSRIGDRCVGYHCPTCGEPCSMMGHDCPEAKP